MALKAPPQPGNYEVRCLAAASPYPTLARAPITIVDATATLTAPTSVAAGEEFAIQWTGPDNKRPTSSVSSKPMPPKAPTTDRTITHRKGSTLKLRAPDAAGDGELRYMMADTPYRTLGRARVQVASTGATVQRAPASVAAGSTLWIQWQGPNNPRNFITIVPVREARARVRHLRVYERRQSGVVGSA